MDKILIAIGGGEIRNKTTLEIDRYIVKLINQRKQTQRGVALFLGTASHDSMPYFNSFRKTYTSVFDIKAEVGLLVYGENSVEKIAQKIDKADMIYVGGGDTVFMIDLWKEKGIDKLIFNAYQNGKIICGLSAGAICYFEKMYSDSEKFHGGKDYKIFNGLNFLQGTITPHYNERVEDFDQTIINDKIESAIAIENDCAVEFVNGKITKSISCGGKAFIIKNENGVLTKTVIEGREDE